MPVRLEVVAAVRAGVTVEIALVLPAAAPRLLAPPPSRSPSPPPAAIVAAGVSVTGFALFGVFGAMSLSAREGLAGDGRGGAPEWYLHGLFG